MNDNEISKAFTYHLKWKSYLRKFVDGEGDFDIAEISPEGCNLGKWLSSGEINLYASPDEIQAVISLHNDIHDAARQVYELKMSGQDSAAKRELSKINKYSMDLHSLLARLNIITST